MAAKPSKSSRCSGLCSQISRHKSLDRDVLTTPLARCLTTGDLTFLGLGYMIGPGIYVVTGTVVQDLAGPGATISYIIAGFAALLSALCYAEFSSRIPLAGSAYTYTYVAIGEVWAFIVGWNMLLEYLIAVASSAKAWSATLDAVCDRVISSTLMEIMPLPHLKGLGPYPDFIAVATILLVVVFIASGAKASVTFNNVLTVMVLISIVLVICTGFSVANVEIWTNSTTGGFLPFGWGGVFQASATCFYAYLGFDGIAVAAEEAINPKEALPWAIGISMVTVTILYVLATAALTLMVPYTSIYSYAPFPAAFGQLGITWAMYAVSFGSLVAITTTLIGGMYFLPRVAYSMGSDGLIFSIFGQINKSTQTPVAGIAILGFIASALAVVIDLNALVLLMSIGTVISFTFVASSVLILRYQDMENLGSSRDNLIQAPDTEEEHWTARLGTKREILGVSWFGCRDKIIKSDFFADQGQERWTIIAIVVLVVGAFGLSLLVVHGLDHLQHCALWSMALLVVFILCIVCCLFLMSVMTQTVYENVFQVPLVPVLPVMSIVCNIFMVMLLDVSTWIRLAVWMVLGFIVYFGYGLRYSKENQPAPRDPPEPNYGTVKPASDPIESVD